MEWWNTVNPGVPAALVTALLLGIIHGLVPDEHTWPITFSYAVGSYSTRGGLRAGLLFSLTFTLQRAIACELAWLGLSHWMQSERLNQMLLIPIGLLMAAGGWLMQRRRHVHGKPASSIARLTGRMPALHGFIAGWGFGAFALILYSTLAPAMPSVWWGWLPGALFGIGTALIQGAAGALFGGLASHQHLSAADMEELGLVTASRTLAWGGIAYTLAGIAGLTDPALAHWEIATGLSITGMAHVDLPIIIAILAVAGIGLFTFVTRLRKLRRRD